MTPPSLPSTPSTLLRVTPGSILAPAVEGKVLARLSEMDVEEAPALADLVSPATRLLASRYGLILVPADFTLTMQALPALSKAHRNEGAGRIVLPVGPVVAVSAVTAGSEDTDIKTVGDWWYKSGQLFFPINGEMHKAGEAAPVVVAFMAGVPVIPHLLAMALALICRHWKQTPADQATGELGSDRVAIEHLIEPHTWHGGGQVGRAGVEGESWLS